MEDVAARSTFGSQTVESSTCSDHFWMFRCRFVWQTQGTVHLEGFVALAKTMAGARHFKRIWKQYKRHEFIRDVRRSGRWCPEMDCNFWSIRSSASGRWICLIDSALRMTCPHFVRGGRSTLDRWSGKITKRTGTRLSAQHATFHFWRKSCRIALFSKWPWGSKVDEGSQTYFFLDVVKFKFLLSLASQLWFQDWKNIGT